MNNLSIYATAVELSGHIEGARVRDVLWLPSAVIMRLEGSDIGTIHVVHHRKGVDIAPTEQPYIDISLGREIMSEAAGSTVTSVEPEGLDRSIKITLKSRVNWGEKAFFLKLNLIPQIQSISLSMDEKGRAVEELGISSGERPSHTARIKEKEFTLLGLDAGGLLDLLVGLSRTERESSLPPHTVEWRTRKRLSEELCTRVSGIDPVLADLLIESYGTDPLRVVEALKKIEENLVSGKFHWCIYRYSKSGSGGKPLLYPLELPISPGPIREMSFSESVHFMMENITLPSYREKLLSAASKPIKRELKRLERLKKNLEGDLQEAKKADEYRHYGNLLATYRHMLRRGMESVSLKDFSGDRELLIPLDPSLDPEGNIKRYFTKARKGEKGLVIIRERRKRAENEMERLKASLEQIKEKGVSELLNITLSGVAAGERKKERGREKKTRFRSFKLDEKHTVLVGRNDSENDELTHHFASPSDIWFHAQGVPGSHVILKGADRSTSKTIIQKAASIAAFFSKARHSSTVPVVYTEKRYVRKPRRSKPGTAVVQRSKTIFVTPELPDVPGT